jgi:hypothetical protein
MVSASRWCALRLMRSGSTRLVDQLIEHRVETMVVVAVVAVAGAVERRVLALEV